MCKKLHFVVVVWILYSFFMFLSPWFSYSFQWQLKQKQTNKKTGFKSSQQRDFEQLLSVKWGNIFQRDG